MSHTLADIIELPADVQQALDKPGHSLGYRNVSQTQLSLARYFGGTMVNERHYTYIQGADELIRDDVLKAIVQHKKQIAALEELSAIDQQLGLWA